MCSCSVCMHFIIKGERCVFIQLTLLYISRPGPPNFHFHSFSFRTQYYALARLVPHRLHVFLPPSLSLSPLFIHHLSHRNLPTPSMEQNRSDSVAFQVTDRHEHRVVDIELTAGDAQRLLHGGGGGVGGGAGTTAAQTLRQSLYVNSLSSREMDSLAALCDTFLPSVRVPSDVKGDDAVATFYQTSASMAGTPQRVGGLLSERVKHPKMYFIRVALWMLSTWIGTFVLCGRASLSTHFPYLQAFSQVSLRQREVILLSWSLSYFSLLRMLFKATKLLTLLIFFTQVDENDKNLAWKAIDYCGPDPNFKTQSVQTKTPPEHPRNNHQRTREHEQEGDEPKEEIFGPLYKGLIHLQHPREIAVQTLRRSGFPTSICHRRKFKAPSISHPSLIIRCDAVIIGSGSGGGVVAGVLAKAGYKVLVLEKGNYCARSNLSLLEGPTMDQMYDCGGLVATADTGILILSGSTVGGGSTINWSASIRTPQHVINEWCDHHEIELFDSKLYKDAMDVVCEKMGVQSEICEEGFNNAVLRRGCLELGYPVSNIPRNSPPDHYCGWCCLGCKDGRKKGTLETWLVDLVNSGNGVILPESEAIKVLHKRKKGRTRNTATGVAFEFKYKGAKEICVVESRVTIVACGALGTPALLRRSGLKNANIGKNLHLHPVTMAWGYFPNTPFSGEWPEEGKKSYEGGIMTAMSTVVGNFDGSGYGAVIQTPALHPGMFSSAMPWVSGSDIKKRMCRFSRTAHIFALARDKGSGKVVSPSSIGYQMDAVDEENLKKGIEKMLRILAAAGAEEIGTHHCKGKTINVKNVSSHEFERFVKEESARPLRDLSTTLCSAHQMGSCRMGVNPKNSAVNQIGETWEVEGLFVADTSVFPTALGVNPMVTVQAIAYCTAQSILEALKRKKSRY
ncbi:long-chain-alcohol oxidase FAO4A [Malania oleifera]|uniref:long-chain-alcohol oxidase FAO4A n=1 Tax=Malania oleifera TaxID=397392 RepID=UPI0025AE37A5|nr:long-chain-alcohol oxidase FAO4A [Malania oleifera]